MNFVTNLLLNLTAKKIENRSAFDLVTGKRTVALLF